MPLLLHSTIFGFLRKVLGTDFIPDYGTYHETTGYTDACWYGTEDENVCTNNGFCSTSEDGEDASCDCTYGWGGDYCTENTLIDLCGDSFCYNDGECVVGLNGEEGTSCYCQPGYTGDSCELEDETVDFCEGIMCSGTGHCIEAVGATPQWECVCQVGFGGPTCGETLDDCDGVFLLDMFSRLAITSGDLNASMECGFSNPTLFEDTHPALYDTATFSYCVCADTWAEYGYDDYLNQLENCVMDKYRPLTYMEMSESYCPFCDDNQDEIMESLITSKSDTCYHFVYERETMALYWRTMWKCFCMFSIGTPSTIETVVNCPFTKHTSKDDFISWENCKSDNMCQWNDMYRYFEEEYALIDLEGSTICKSWIESWIFITPDDYALLEDMQASFCPCLETVRGHCDGCDFALNCIPITFHELTMVEAFDQICNDDLILNRDCINYIGYIAIELGTLNFTAATMCYSAMDLSAGLYDLSDNLQNLMCGCLGPAATLLSDDTYQSDNFELALSCIDDAFSMDLTACSTDLYDGDSFVVPVSTDYEMLSVTSEADVVTESKGEEQKELGVAADAETPGTNVQFSVNYWTSDSSWRGIAIGEFVALLIFSGSAYGLNRRKKQA